MNNPNSLPEGHKIVYFEEQAKRACSAEAIKIIDKISNHIKSISGFPKPHEWSINCDSMTRSLEEIQNSQLEIIAAIKDGTFLHEENVRLDVAKEVTHFFAHSYHQKTRGHAGCGENKNGLARIYAFVPVI